MYNDLWIVFLKLNSAGLKVTKVELKKGWFLKNYHWLCFPHNNIMWSDLTPCSPTLFTLYMLKYEHFSKYINKTNKVWINSFDLLLRLKWKKIRLFKCHFWHVLFFPLKSSIDPIKCFILKLKNYELLLLNLYQIPKTFCYMIHSRPGRINSI